MKLLAHCWSGTADHYTSTTAPAKSRTVPMGLHHCRGTLPLAHEAKTGRVDSIRADRCRRVERTKPGFFSSENCNQRRSRIPVLSGIDAWDRHHALPDGVWRHRKTPARCQRRAATRYHHRSRRLWESRSEIEQEDREVAKSTSPSYQAHHSPR